MKEIFVSTSSIKFVNPADNSVLQSLAATDSGFDFGGAIISGSTLSGSALHVTGNAFIGGNLTLGDANTDSIEITADLTSDLIRLNKYLIDGIGINKSVNRVTNSFRFPISKIPIVLVFS